MRHSQTVSTGKSILHCSGDCRDCPYQFPNDIMHSSVPEGFWQSPCPWAQVGFSLMSRGEKTCQSSKHDTDSIRQLEGKNSAAIQISLKTPKKS